MDQTTTRRADMDAIDRFAEDLQRQPHRSEDLKRAFRERFGHWTGAPRAVATPVDDDPEDLWDNVPV